MYKILSLILIFLFPYKAFALIEESQVHTITTFQDPLQDQGNFLPIYIDTFVKATGLPSKALLWSSGNDHWARVEAALISILQIERDVKKSLKGTNPIDHILIYGHSHGGQVMAVISHLLGLPESDKQLKKLLDIMVKTYGVSTFDQVAKAHKILLGVDNTFASPYLQNPMDMGADIVMHSVTKYLGGHSDVVMGALMLNDDALAERLYFIQNSCGAVPGPMDSFLVLRGIKTLHLRIQRHCENSKAIAQFLAAHPKVDKVYWPGFESHPNHEVAKKQMKDFGGMLSFSLVGNRMEDAFKVVSSTHYFTLAESLGGVESLCGHPASMTHAAIPKEERERTGVIDSLIRLSVGVEDIDDLKLDIDQALNQF